MKTLNKKSIDNLFKNGKWINGNIISAIYSPSNEFQYMVSAPIKKFKKAVDRNKIKRLLRICIQNNIKNNFNIAFIYTDTEIKNLDIINNDVKKILNSLK